MPHVLVTHQQTVERACYASSAGTIHIWLRVTVTKHTFVTVFDVFVRSLLMNGHDTASDGKWQTVKGRDRPQDGNKKVRAPELTPSTVGQVSATDSAFSALDNWYDQNKQRHQKPSLDSEEDASHSAGSDDEHSSSTEATKSTAQAEPRKAKKPKVKKPKVRPAQAASCLEVSKYQDLLSTVQQTYPDNQLSQLQTIADQLLASFQSSELPFNKLLSEQPVEKVGCVCTACNYYLLQHVMQTVQV